MAKILSKDVKVYPTAYRGQMEDVLTHKLHVFNPESRLFTEENTVRPFVSLSDYKNTSAADHDEGSFVISNYEQAPFEFVICGYYFCLLKGLSKIVRDNFSDKSAIYAKIKIKTTASDDSTDDEDNIKFDPYRLIDVRTNPDQSLDILDDNYYFNGLQIVDNMNDDSAGVHYLLLATKKNSTWSVPEQSKLKYKSSSIYGGIYLGTRLPLNKYLETSVIGLDNKIFSTLENNRTCVNFNTGNADLEGALTILNQGTSNYISTPRLTNDSNYGLKIYTQGTNKAIDIESTGKINMKSTDDIIIQTSSSNTQNYILPDTSANEPAFTTETTEHTLATREWVDSTVNLTTSSVSHGTNNKVTVTVGNVSKDVTIDKVDGAYTADRADDVYVTKASNPNNGSTVSYYLTFRGNSEYNKYTDIYGIDTSPCVTLTTSSGSTSKKFTTNMNTEVNGTLYVSGASTLTGNILGKGTFTIQKSNTNKFTVSNDGVVWADGSITGDSFNAESDARLKENIKPYHCEKSILDLPIVEFDYKESGTHSLGCIAQDLEEICPDLVVTDEKGYLNVKESKIVYLLINEVKELKVKLEALMNNK